jgi:hypothetical protein
MKERILTNWTFVRVLFVVIGISIIVQSVMARQWFGVFFGGYFTSMGIFSFGCASGKCFGVNCRTETSQSSASDFQDVEFEEVK